MLFSLAAITVVEMARDLEQHEREVAAGAGAKAMVNVLAQQRLAKKREQKAEG
jgi:hypothetical protein